MVICKAGYQPLRNDNPLIAPPSMNILINLSSARMSYTDTSPDVKPTPTTSIAGDCTNAVIAADVIFAKPCTVSNFEVENLCMHILKPAYAWMGQIHRQNHSLSSHIPQLQVTFTASYQHFVQISCGMQYHDCSEADIKLDSARE